MKEIKYKMVGDYMLPDFGEDEKEAEMEQDLGIYALLRKEFLMEYRKLEYMNLLTTGKLTEHLLEVEKQAQELTDMLTEQMKERQGLTEELKAKDQMAWVQGMNNIQNAVREIVREQVIYS